MEKTIKMFIETADGKRMEQDIPQGLVDIYIEKGWKEVVEEKPEKEEKTYFNTKRNSK